LVCRRGDEGAWLRENTGVTCIYMYTYTYIDMDRLIDGYVYDIHIYKYSYSDSYIWL